MLISQGSHPRRHKQSPPPPFPSSANRTMGRIGAFLPQPAFPKLEPKRETPIRSKTWKTVESTTCCQFPRRKFLQLLSTSVVTFAPPPAHSWASRPLSASLPPLINLQSTLSTLSNEIEHGTNADIRRVVKTLLIASDIPNNLRDAATFLPSEKREGVLVKGREAYEFLNQVVEYYDPVDVKGKAQGEVMAFCLEAVRKAGEGIAEVVNEFGEEGERVRREMAAADGS